jgi:bifunctional NMN adenylyltransferase/nudix hydrolase
MSVGVIIGRFQVHELHEGHIELINFVIAKHSKVIIFLGISNSLVTKNNPLDFVTRKAMILKHYQQITVLPLKDKRDDAIWSKNIDEKIQEIYPLDDVTLYGSRDSFIPYYCGIFKTQEVEQKYYVSGTESRKNVSEEIKSSPDFRAGVIYAAYNQYPIVHPTVDIAIIKGKEILLAKKPNESKYRFVGGFADPSDQCFEHTAKREVYEETKLEVDDIKYIMSSKIDDWRYRNEETKIISILYVATYIFGRPEPSDDISELRWFHSDSIKLDNITDEHKYMMSVLLQKIFNLQ